MSVFFFLNYHQRITCLYRVELSGKFFNAFIKNAESRDAGPGIIQAESGFDKEGCYFTAAATLHQMK